MRIMKMMRDTKQFTASQCLIAVLVAVLACDTGLGQSSRSKSSKSGRSDRSSSSSDRSSSSDSSAGGATDDYRLLVTKNIFVRDRTSRGPRPDQPRPTPPAPERGMVLRGIVAQDQEQLAYIENLATNEVLRVMAGQKAGPGVVQSVGTDSIQFQAGEQVRKVQIGMTLEGKDAPDMASMTTATQPSGGSSTQPGGAPNSIEELLRQRRLRGQ